MFRQTFNIAACIYRSSSSGFHNKVMKLLVFMLIESTNTLGFQVAQSLLRPVNVNIPSSTSETLPQVISKLG